MRIPFILLALVILVICLDSTIEAKSSKRLTSTQRANRKTSTKITRGSTKVDNKRTNSSNTIQRKTVTVNKSSPGASRNSTHISSGHNNRNSTHINSGYNNRNGTHINSGHNNRNSTKINSGHNNRNSTHINSGHNNKTNSHSSYTRGNSTIITSIKNSSTSQSYPTANRNSTNINRTNTTKTTPVNYGRPNNTNVKINVPTTKDNDKRTQLNIGSSSIKHNPVKKESSILDAFLEGVKKGLETTRKPIVATKQTVVKSKPTTTKRPTTTIPTTQRTPLAPFTTARTPLAPFSTAAPNVNWNTGSLGQYVCNGQQMPQGWNANIQPAVNPGWNVQQPAVANGQYGGLNTPPTATGHTNSWSVPPTPGVNSPPGFNGQLWPGTATQGIPNNQLGTAGTPQPFVYGPQGQICTFVYNQPGVPGASGQQQPSYPMWPNTNYPQTPAVNPGFANAGSQPGGAITASTMPALSAHQPYPTWPNANTQTGAFNASQGFPNGYTRAFGYPQGFQYPQVGVSHTPGYTPNAPTGALNTSQGYPQGFQYPQVGVTHTPGYMPNNQAGAFNSSQGFPNGYTGAFGYPQGFQYPQVPNAPAGAFNTSQGFPNGGYPAAFGYPQGFQYPQVGAPNTVGSQMSYPSYPGFPTGQPGTFNTTQGWMPGSTGYPQPMGYPVAGVNSSAGFNHTVSYQPFNMWPNSGNPTGQVGTFNVSQASTGAFNITQGFQYGQTGFAGFPPGYGYFQTGLNNSAGVTPFNYTVGNFGPTSFNATTVPVMNNAPYPAYPGYYSQPGFANTIQNYTDKPVYQQIPMPPLMVSG